LNNKSLRQLFNSWHRSVNFSSARSSLPQASLNRDIAHSFDGLDTAGKIADGLASDLLETLPVQRIVIHSKKEKRCSSNSLNSP
jgi:hypothetical protein